MFMNKTLIDVFEKLKKTKYKDLYQINPKVGTMEEITQTFKELGLRMSALAFIFFCKKVLIPVSGKMAKVPQDRLLTNPDGAMVVLVLGAFSPVLKDIMSGKIASFDIEKMKIFRSVLKEDLPLIREELQKDIEVHQKTFDVWIDWLINHYEEEKSSDEKLFEVVSKFATSLKEHKSIKELEEAGKPLLDLYNTKEGNEAVWRTQRVKHGFPGKTEELYFSIVNILILSDVVYSSGYTME